MLSDISLYVISTGVILGIFVLIGILIFLTTFLYFLAMRLLITPRNKKTVRRNRVIGISNLLVASIIIWILINFNETSDIHMIMTISGIGIMLLSIIVLRKKNNSQNQYSMPVR